MVGPDLPGQAEQERKQPRPATTKRGSRAATRAIGRVTSPAGAGCPARQAQFDQLSFGPSVSIWANKVGIRANVLLKPAKLPRIRMIHVGSRPQRGTHNQNAGPHLAGWKSGFHCAVGIVAQQADIAVKPGAQSVGSLAGCTNSAFSPDPAAGSERRLRSPRVPRSSEGPSRMRGVYVRAEQLATQARPWLVEAQASEAGLANTQPSPRIGR